MKPSDLVKVKALEWERDDSGPWGVQETAYSMGYKFFVWKNPGIDWCAEISTGEDDCYSTIMRRTNIPTEADAKAACQAHYESMIYQLLEVR